MQLYSVAQTAQALNLAEPTIRLWIREGKLGHVRLGTRVLVSQDELARLIGENSTPASR